MRFSTRIVFVLLASSSLGLLVSGLLLGDWARLQPCHLCNFQRLLYMVLAFFALCGALMPALRRWWGAKGVEGVNRVMDKAAEMMDNIKSGSHDGDQ